MEQVEGFTGKHSFLDLEYQSPVFYQGLIYPSVAHAFQAARTNDEHLKQRIADTIELTDMYALVTYIRDTAEWQKTRVRVMELLLRDKFRRNRDLQQRLIDTGHIALINSYPDASNPNNSYWGTVRGQGHNKVGRLLEAIRKDLVDGREVDEWLHCSFELVHDRDKLPVILLHCFRGSQKLHLIEVRRKSYMILGSKGDIKLLHPSISRQHAALIVDDELGPCIVDLGSKHGTWLGEAKLRVGIAAPLQEGDQLKFGCSSKEYKVELDFTEATREIERKKRQLDAEIRRLDEMSMPKKRR